MGRSVPLSVTYHVTYRCDLRCSYCYQPRSSEELSTSEAIRLIEMLVKRGLFRLGFSGGEPLLREDLGELVRGARAKGVVVNLFSNGHHLPERLDLVHDLDALFVSLDGPARVHDALCGPGAYGRTMAGVQAARRAGMSVTLVAVVTERSLDGVEELLTCAAEVGARIAYQPVIPSWGAREVTGALDFEQQRALFCWLAARKRAGAPVANSIAHIRGAIRDPDNPIRGPCPAGKFMATILPDGSVTSCCEHYFGYQRQQAPSTASAFGEELERLAPPTCTRCATIGNIEAKRLCRLSPAAVLDLWNLLRG